MSNNSSNNNDLIYNAHCIVEKISNESEAQKLTTEIFLN